IILLSFLIIGLAILLLTLFDSDKDLAAVAFECFSAYSTVGLSVGITPALSIPSKIVITCTMFLGRVGTLTLLIALVNKITTKHYKYPRENIFIN
ncbi:MAG: ATPase, partial [Bacteroidota bacterium]|nr:ATPase [Bacteroidota bacterium]